MKRFCLLLTTLLLCGFSNAQTKVALVKPEGGKTWGYINETGEYIIEPIYRKCFPFGKEGWAVTQNPKTKKYEFINLKGEKLECELSEFSLKSVFGFGIKGFDHGLAPIGKDKKWGFMNKEGKVLIPLEYKKVGTFESDYAYALKGDEWMLLDKEGNEITIKTKVAQVKDVVEGFAPFVTEDKKHGFVNTKGEVAIEPTFLGVGYFVDGLAWARSSNEKIGFINTKGEWVIEPQFVSAKDFGKGENWARVKNPEWVYVNREGKLLQPQKEAAGNFSEALAKAKRVDQWGFINESGEWSIQPQFEGVRDFKNGMAAAKKNGLWGFVNQSGDWVVKPQYAAVKDMELVD